MPTKAEICEQLDAAGIEHDPSGVKAALLALLPPTDPETPPRTSRPVWEAGETRQQYHSRVRAWKIEQRSS